MRRYMLGSLETDEVGLKSSQSFRNSEPSSSQMENSQCSSFDLFSQMMSQQQGYNSQPASEASQVAQKYYTKFASKPSLFRNSTGGKEVISVGEKSGLTRQKSFQDLQEFQKQKVRDKEGRDLICTLISLLKESTDEIKHVVEKLQSNVQLQITSASVKTEEALSKTQQCLQDYCKDMMQEVIDKLNVYQTNEETEKILKEKEAIVKTLHSELESSRAVKYDEMKQMLQDTCSDHLNINMGEVKKVLQEACNSWKTDQQKCLDDFCDATLGKMEEKLKDCVQQLSQEKSRDQLKIREGSNSQVAEVALSESQNLPVSHKQVQPGHSYGSGCGNRPTFQSQYLPPALPSNAVHAQLKPNVPSGPVRDHGLPSDAGSLTTKDIYVDGKIGSTGRFNFMNHNSAVIPDEQRMTFSSPTLCQQSVIQASLPPPFARWGTKGPSPVAAVAPLMQETSQPAALHCSMNRQQSVVPRKQDRRRGPGMSKRSNYQQLPPQRRSARLKERKVEGIRQYPTAAASSYSQELQHENKILKRGGYKNAYMKKIKHSKAQAREAQLDFKIAQSSQRRSHLTDMYGQKNNEGIVTIPSGTGNFTDYVQSGGGCNMSRQPHVFWTTTGNLQQSLKKNSDQSDGGFHTVHQFTTPGYGPSSDESDDSSSEETFLSAAQHHADEVSSSQDLFIDAIDDQQMNTSDEEEDDEVGLSFFHQEDPKRSQNSNNYCRDSRVTTEFTRAVTKKRTLWGSASPQKRDLHFFLTSSLRRKTNVT